MQAILRAVAAGLLAFPTLASAHLFNVPSPNHEQTFAYGSERRQAWLDDHGQLALSTEFTNDPYVDQDNLRQYDDFLFHFPSVRLGADGRTFYYHPPHGPAIAVAERHRGFLGLDEVSLLDNAVLVLRRPHGYLSLSLLVNDRPVETTASL
jgi:hypothetical protein